MNFFADECVYPSTVTALRSWHHNVETAQDAGLVGQDGPVGTTNQLNEIQSPFLR